MRKVVSWLRNDAGMNTAEYAVGTLAAALMKVLTSDSIRAALTDIIGRALN